LSPYELSALCEELSDAVARACDDYEVAGWWLGETEKEHLPSVILSGR